MQQKTFAEQVVKIVRSIPPGRVMTYGNVAQTAGGGAMTARSITTILRKAYDKGVGDIPFHRVVYSNGHVWINAEYRKRRLKLYKEEGIELDEKNKIVSFQDLLIKF